MLGRVINLSRPALEVAPLLLGAVLWHGTWDDAVGVRLTEVEAYMGPDDAASHAFRGPTPRTTVMFGPPAHLYVYLSYGIHRCVNIVCSPDGRATAVLLRAGEVIAGQETARARRGPRIPERRLASGPGNLGQALGAELSDSGAELALADDGVSPWRLQEADAPATAVASTRIGISRNVDKPWRFTIPGDPTVSR